MKTAVDWLEDNLLSEPWAEEHFKHNSECWDKAKEMEKEQMKKAYNHSRPNLLCYEKGTAFKQYHKETFNK